MGKRFTDTNKYKKPFIRGLQGAYKLLWDYLYHDCDHAGIWIVDFEVAQLYVGNDMPIKKEIALKKFNETETKVIELDNGKKWFIPSFIIFQYGQLSEKNRAHLNVIILLKKYNLIDENNNLIFLSKPLTSTLQGAKEKEKEQEQEMEMEEEQERGEEKSFQIIEMQEPEIEVYPTFEDFWDEYGKKVGEKEKLKKKWDTLTLKDREAIMDYIPNYKVSEPNKKFRKNPETFLNNKSWNDEIIIDNGKQQQTIGTEKARKWNQHFAQRTGSGT